MPPYPEGNKTLEILWWVYYFERGKIYAPNTLETIIIGIITIITTIIYFKYIYKIENRKRKKIQWKNMKKSC